LAIDLRDKYRYDIFRRTQWNTIALQIVFAGITLAVFLFILQYVETRTTQIVISGISEVITGENFVAGAAIPEKVEAAKNRLSIVVFIMLAVITAAFGYIIARVALRPARDALQSQKQFIGNIAHELRTPLSIIKTNTEVTLLANHIAEPIRRTLQSNIEELDRASQIINNLLTLNSLIRPERIDFQNVNMAEIVESATKKLANLARGRHSAIDIEKDRRTVVWGNATALEQVAMNVIKNALSYTPASGHISVRIERLDQYVHFTVRDNGIGIDRKDLFHIFEPFYRAERSRRRQGAGSGLGLTIVQEIVKLHGGKISIQSELGQGTTVRITLPTGHDAKTAIEKAKAGRTEYAVDYSQKEKPLGEA
jgi:signal transduction histidine kinase